MSARRRLWRRTRSSCVRAPRAYAPELTRLDEPRPRPARVRQLFLRGSAAATMTTLSQGHRSRCRGSRRCACAFAAPAVARVIRPLYLAPARARGLRRRGYWVSAHLAYPPERDEVRRRRRATALRNSSSLGWRGSRRSFSGVVLSAVGRCWRVPPCVAHVRRRPPEHTRHIPAECTPRAAQERAQRLFAVRGKTALDEVDARLLAKARTAPSPCAAPLPLALPQHASATSAPRRRRS